MTATAPLPDPEPIVALATGYMAAKQLFAAARIGLFRAIGDKPANVAELAASTGTPVRVVAILAASMAAAGLLTHTEDGYGLTPQTAAYLGADASLRLDPYLRFLDEISYPHWQGFEQTVRTGEPGTLNLDEAGLTTFLTGVQTYNTLHARMLAANFDFTVYRSMLDLGGLSGAFSINAMTASPRLTTTFAYDHRFTDGVRQLITQAGLADRCTIVGTDPVAARPAGPFDLVLMNHVIHRFSAADNAAILAHARAAAGPRGRLLLVDFYLDEKSQRGLDALHAAEYLVIDGTVVYAEAEVRRWLGQAGWRVADTIALPGSPRVMVCDAC